MKEIIVRNWTLIGTPPIFNLNNIIMFHKHNWEVISEKTLPSALQQGKIKIDKGDIPHWFFTKKYILVLQCKKCGKLDKTVEENP